jgi:hypothetical protein
MKELALHVIHCCIFIIILHPIGQNAKYAQSLFKIAPLATMKLHVKSAILTLELLQPIYARNAIPIFKIV